MSPGITPSGSLLAGLSYHNINVEGNRDIEGWKLTETDDSSLISAQFLASLGGTQVGAHGLVLAADAKYSPMGNNGEEGAALIDCWLDSKMDKDSVYAPSLS